MKEITKSCKLLFMSYNRGLFVHRKYGRNNKQRKANRKKLQQQQ